MTQQFVRQTRNTSYIAYESKPSKKPVQLSVNGEMVQERLHPDVFINEYVQVNIKSVDVGESTANIKFDASTVVTGSEKKMKYDFGGNVQVDSPLMQLAQQALETNRPVYAALETRRAFKNYATKEIIPWETPIHVLRGCENGPQSSANSNKTRENCSKIVAALGFADEPQVTLVSDEARSNPYKWENVRDNQDGDMPPTGCVIPKGPNGEPVGGIIQAPAKAQNDGAGSGDVMAKLEALTKMVSHLQRTASADAGKKPWNEFLDDGSINPSSYAVSQVRRTRADAVRYIAAVAPENAEVEQLRQWESELTGNLLWVADQVQANICGQVDRMAKAHTEAGAWVAHVAQFEQPFAVEMLADKDARRGWVKQLRDTATIRYREAIEMTRQASEVTTQSPAGQQPKNPPQQAQPQATPAGQPQAPVDTPAQPAQTPPQTQAQPQADAPMFAHDGDARDKWDGLIAHIGMEEHVSDLNPALTVRFGTHLAAQIPAAAMRAALDEWCADPAAFKQWAEQQYKHAQNGQVALPASA